MIACRLLMPGGGLLAVLAGPLPAARTGQPKRPEQAGTPEASARRPVGRRHVGHSEARRGLRRGVPPGRRSDSRGLFGAGRRLHGRDGSAPEGRDAIQKAFEESFAANKGLKVRIDSLSLRFLTQGVAVEDGTTELYPADAGPPSYVRYSILHDRRTAVGCWAASGRAPTSRPETTSTCAAWSGPSVTGRARQEPGRAVRVGLFGRPEFSRRVFQERPEKNFATTSCRSYNRAGNVLQWCSDGYAVDFYSGLARDGVQRCGPNARHGCTPDTGMSHVGISLQTIGQVI